MFIDALPEERHAVTALARACQIAVADAGTWSGWPDLRSLSVLFENLPAPIDLDEAGKALLIATPFVERLAEYSHRCVHRIRGTCGFQPPLLSTAGLSPHAPGAWSPGKAIAQWLAKLDRALRRTHTEDPIAVARRRLAEPNCPSMGKLAREVGCGRGKLEYSFFSTVGMTMGEYRLRERVIAIVRVLGTPNGKSEAAALAVGWKTTKPMYEAFEQFDLIPSEVRRWTAEQRDTGIAALLKRRPKPRRRRVPGILLSS